VTISGHDEAMRQVRIAELKARLSEHLRAVRRGEIITVLDRDTPIARIAPIGGPAALRVRRPAPGTPRPGRVRVPGPLKLKVDVVRLLLEERQGHR
jgi:antitoxin (DNA-binding transcriptional repressor) of toxin-antitoxin stability system